MKLNARLQALIGGILIRTSQNPLQRETQNSLKIEKKLRMAAQEECYI